ncbi:MAG: hypothetical protein FJX78_06425 [Armatimonadetes bacterium]|nr:hypothetical protein [Armatimonadota bacterium]
MRKSREELRRGLRALIRDTSRQLRDLEDKTPAAEGPAKPLLPDPESLARQAPAEPPAATDADTDDRGVQASPMQAGSEPVVQLDVLSPVPPPAEAPAATSERPVEAEPRVRRKVAYLPGVERVPDPTTNVAEPVTTTLPLEATPAPHAMPPHNPPAVAPSPALDEARERLLRAELEDLAHYDERRGVCFAFFLNRNCWDVDDAFCNHALQVCMLRNCPVYHLHREALEKQFAAKFKHLW